MGTQVECLVLSVNDFGDTINFSTHQQVSDHYVNYPTDESLRRTLIEYSKWEKYKSTLISEIHDYNQDPANFGLPIHMPEYDDQTHGDQYLHMYVDRKGPGKRKKGIKGILNIETLHPPKIGVDHFTNK